MSEDSLSDLWMTRSWPVRRRKSVITWMLYSLASPLAGTMAADIQKVRKLLPTSMGIAGRSSRPMKP